MTNSEMIKRIFAKQIPPPIKTGPLLMVLDVTYSYSDSGRVVIADLMQLHEEQTRDSELLEAIIRVLSGHDEKAEVSNDCEEVIQRITIAPPAVVHWIVTVVLN